VKNPVGTLLDKNYAAKIRAMTAPDRAGVSLVIKPGVFPHPFPTPHEGTNTTHYSIVDQWGNAVSVTYTLNNWFGAKVTAAHTGVLLNDEMDDFTIKAGVPNSFGLVQGEANAIAPGKRPLSSMSPTIVTKDGKPVMVLGTPGGSRIITTVLLTILNVINYGMDIQQAVDAPRFHQQWLPDFTNLEADEFAALMLAVTMRSDMRHKIGYGKPIGLGSIRINATKLRLVDYATRYTAFGVNRGITEYGLNEVTDLVNEQMQTLDTQVHNAWVSSQCSTSTRAVLSNLALAARQHCQVRISKPKLVQR